MKKMLKSEAGGITLIFVFAVVLGLLVIFAIGLLMNTAEVNAMPRETPFLDVITESVEENSMYPTTGIINGSAVRFRERPDTGSKIFEEMRSGSMLTVFSEENGWCYCRRNNLYGYVKADYVIYVPEN